jgi:hypothetical protein
MANFMGDSETVAPWAVTDSIPDHERAVLLFPEVAICRHFSRLDITDSQAMRYLADVHRFARTAFSADQFPRKF